MTSHLCFNFDTVAAVKLFSYSFKEVEDDTIQIVIRIFHDE